MSRFAQLLAGVVGAFFAVIGAAKITGQFGLEGFLEIGWPVWVFELTAIAELFGGIALFFPRTRRPASLALLAVIALLCWQPATGSYGPTAGGGVMIALLSLVFLSTVVPERDSV